jgi:hypothetical protein
MLRSHLRGTAVCLVGLVLSIDGCAGIFDSDEPNLSLRLDADSVERTDTWLEIDVGGRQFTLIPGQNIEAYFSPLGEVPVSVELKTSGEVIVAEAFALRFFENADHWIHIEIGLDRPFGHCVGLVTAHSLSAPPTDSLFVIRGSLRRDVVC